MRRAQLVTAATDAAIVDVSNPGGETSKCLAVSYEHGLGLLIPFGVVHYMSKGGCSGFCPP